MVVDEIYASQGAEYVAVFAQQCDHGARAGTGAIHDEVLKEQIRPDGEEHFKKARNLHKQVCDQGRRLVLYRQGGQLPLLVREQGNRRTASWPSGLKRLTGVYPVAGCSASCLSEGRRAGA